MELLTVLATRKKFLTLSTCAAYGTLLPFHKVTSCPSSFGPQLCSELAINSPPSPWPYWFWYSGREMASSKVTPPLYSTLSFPDLPLLVVITISPFCPALIS